MLIAEELLLLLVDDETGKVRPIGTDVGRGLAGAVLIELATLGLVDVAHEGEEVREGRLVVRPGDVPDHPVLADAVSLVAELSGSTPARVLEKLAKGLRDRIVDGLVVGGVLRREKHRVLGIFPTERVPAQDTAHEAQVRARLHAVLTGAAPDPRSAALISLLQALEVLTSVIEVPDKRAARKIAKDLTESEWAAGAVRKSVAAVHAAVITAVFVVSAGATSAGAS
ncbi:GOLPH3/VPS74 family protein [Actinokineospora sp.]|uniref:GOLPH3/VPS74 family protein n=1 Tax=Actinokineospora sp. TaxID=1872133 RepID=UPI0040379BDC